MPILAADLGGTKLTVGIFSNEINLVKKEKILLEKRSGVEVGKLIRDQLSTLIEEQACVNEKIDAVGVAVPGIYNEKEGTVWAPNIPGWDNYPLMKELKNMVPDIPVVIQSDRSCYITAEVEKGKAKGCTDAVFIAVGTGIGAGIISGGKLLKGANDIAGAIGWMALEKQYHPKFASCGCFESSSSGDGIAKHAIEKMQERPDYAGVLKSIATDKLSAHDIFNAFNSNDEVAVAVIRHCIQVWGMALANVVSLLNPQMVIFGGGVFGPAARWLPGIVNEAKRWAQPVSMKAVSVLVTSFGSDAGLIGAACMADQKIKSITTK